MGKWGEKSGVDVVKSAPRARTAESGATTSRDDHVPSASDHATLLSSTRRPNQGDIGGNIGGNIDDNDAKNGAQRPPQSRVPGGGEFTRLGASELLSKRDQERKLFVPAHRFAPLREEWLSLYTPLVSHMGLQVRMNPRRRTVELRTSPETPDDGCLQKGEDFLRAYLLGFSVSDAIALLRLDDLFIETFEINDVKMLRGDHLSRAIGRVAGQAGKTKYTIENTTKTRIVLADQKVHILGSYTNIRFARDAICDLVLGSPPNKVYAKLRTVATRMASRF